MKLSAPLPKVWSQTVRNNITIDWTLRKNVPARLRVLVRRTLNRHGYPAKQAGEGNPDSVGAGGGAVRRVDCCLKRSMKSLLSPGRPLPRLNPNPPKEGVGLAS